MKEGCFYDLKPDFAPSIIKICKFDYDFLNCGEYFKWSFCLLN